jgi:hypothetical protein
MAGGGREGDAAAAGDAHCGEDGLGNEQFGCAHQWSPWLGSRTEEGSPEGQRSLSLTSQLTVARRRGRDR